VSIRAWPPVTAGSRTSQRRKAQVRRQAEDERVVERGGEAAERFGPVGAEGHDLREHRVEPPADLVAGRDPRVDADPLAGRPAQRLDPAVAGRKPFSASSA
jgi:hypothetical protein